MEPRPMEHHSEVRQRDSREATDLVNVPPEPSRCKIDCDQVYGILGIVGTVLNLLVVVLVYVYTPI